MSRMIFSPTKKMLVTLLKRLVGLPINKKDEMLRVAFPAVTSWRVEGEYFEFGVYEGRAMIAAYQNALRTNRRFHFFAFDSFEGLPSSGEGGDKFPEGKYACSQDRFLQNLHNAGVDRSLVTCISGFFDKSLTAELQEQLTGHKAAIVWVDCDLYESTVPVLEFIVPFLQTGTIICFDDWFSYGGNPMKGEIRATREWLEKNPNIALTHYRDFGISGRSFVVQKRSESIS